MNLLLIAFTAAFFVLTVHMADNQTQTQPPPPPTTIGACNESAVAGVDYPNITAPVDTPFKCPKVDNATRIADPYPPSRCQMFHVCIPGSPDQDVKLVCPPKTTFNASKDACDWWCDVACPSPKSDEKDKKEN